MPTRCPDLELMLQKSQLREIPWDLLTWNRLKARTEIYASLNSCKKLEYLMEPACLHLSSFGDDVALLDRNSFYVIRIPISVHD